MRLALAVVFVSVLAALALGTSSAKAYVSGEDGPGYPCYPWESGQIIYTPYGRVQCQYDPSASWGFSWFAI